jgi:cell division protein FtsN
MSDGNGGSGFTPTVIATVGTVAVALIGAMSTIIVNWDKIGQPDGKVPRPPPVAVENLPPEPAAPGPLEVVWLVQLGYFESRVNAEQRLRMLTELGMEGLQIVNAEQYPGLRRKSGSYVVIGPANEAKAREILDKAKGTVTDAFVVNGYRRNTAN